MIRKLLTAESSDKQLSELASKLGVYIDKIIYIDELRYLPKLTEKKDI